MEEQRTSTTSTKVLSFNEREGKRLTKRNLCPAPHVTRMTWRGVVEWVQKEHTCVLLRDIVPGRRCCCLAVSIYSTLSCSLFLMGITLGVHLSIKMSQSLSISGIAHPQILPPTSDMFAPQLSCDGLNGEAWMSGCDCRIKWPNFRPHNPAHVNCLVQ